MKFATATLPNNLQSSLQGHDLIESIGTFLSLPLHPPPPPTCSLPFFVVIGLRTDSMLSSSTFG